MDRLSEKLLPLSAGKKVREHAPVSRLINGNGTVRKSALQNTVTRSKACYDKLPTGISRWSGDTVRVSNSFQPPPQPPYQGSESSIFLPFPAAKA